MWSHSFYDKLDLAEDYEAVPLPDSFSSITALSTVDMPIMSGMDEKRSSLAKAVTKPHAGRRILLPSVPAQVDLTYFAPNGQLLSDQELAALDMKKLSPGQNKKGTPRNPTSKTIYLLNGEAYVIHPRKHKVSHGASKDPEGQFAHVRYLQNIKFPDHWIAVKCHSLDDAKHENEWKNDLANEARILRKLGRSIEHKIRLKIPKKNTKLKQSHLQSLMFQEFIPGEPLHLYLQRCGAELSFERALHIICKLLLQASQLHQGGVIHRDINLENILFDATTGEVKLVDFNLSQLIGVPLRSQWAGRRDYLPPEVLNRTRVEFNEQTEIYALGICAKNILTHLANRITSIDMADYERAMQFVTRMTASTVVGRVQVKRPCIEEAHAFFEDLQFDCQFRNRFRKKVAILNLDDFLLMLSGPTTEATWQKFYANLSGYANVQLVAGNMQYSRSDLLQATVHLARAGISIGNKALLLPANNTETLCDLVKQLRLDAGNQNDDCVYISNTPLTAGDGKVLHRLGVRHIALDDVSELRSKMPIASVLEMGRVVDADIMNVVQQLLPPSSYFDEKCTESIKAGLFAPKQSSVKVGTFDSVSTALDDGFSVSKQPLLSSGIDEAFDSYVPVAAP